ncbi:MAG: thioredoxin family protein [Patescibacteria group bacterium]
MNHSAERGNTKLYVIIGILVIAGILAVVIVTGPQDNKTADQMEAEQTDTTGSAGEVEQNDAMMEEAGDDAMMEEETMMDDSEGMMDDDMTGDAMEKDAMMDGSGQYTMYSASAAQEAAANGDAVIFFAADWCPSCQAADQAFTDQTDEIPAGVTVLKADYDSENELKDKYGVTYQHTYVQVDENGEMITKWNGGDIPELESNIQ